MTVWADVSRAAMGANALLLLGLCGIWARNYREFGSKHSLGLLLFGLVLFGKNALSLYYFVMHATLAGWFDGLPDISATALMVLCVAETFALAFLVWVTWD
jgi:hypothetical protein